MQKQYFEINENLAKLAKTMNSFRDYIENSATNEYKSMVDDVYELAQNAINNNGADVTKVEAMALRYSRQLANYINRYNSIECMCPSVLISGASNFPVRKKEKQNRARDNHYKIWDGLQALKNKIKSVGVSEIIKSSDDNAIEQLQEKIEKLEKENEATTQAKKYFKKNKTFIGFDGFKPETNEKLMEFYKRYGYLRMDNTNNNAEIRRLKGRITEIERLKNAAPAQNFDNQFCKVVENTDLMRLQLIFDGKPDEKIRTILKSNGFKWAPSQGAWQRQLTSNAKCALKFIIKELAV